MRRRGFVRRRHRDVIDKLARLCGELGRIHKAVAADPDAVVRRRQIGHEIAAGIVGHDDAREFRRQVGGFGDHPDACFGARRAGHGAADIVGADLHGLLRVNCGRESTCQHHQAGKHRRPCKRFGHAHGLPPDYEPALGPFVGTV